MLLTFHRPRDNLKRRGIMHFRTYGVYNAMTKSVLLLDRYKSQTFTNTLQVICRLRQD